MINLKQGTEGLSVSKTKLSRKEVVAELPASTPTSKRAKRDVQTASPPAEKLGCRPEVTATVHLPDCAALPGRAASRSPL